MKYLLVGVWHTRPSRFMTGCPHVQTHRTDLHHDAEQASYALTRHAERLDVPDEILLIENENGPKCTYDWTVNRDYSQRDFDDMRAQMMADSPIGNTEKKL